MRGKLVYDDRNPSQELRERISIEMNENNWLRDRASGASLYRENYGTGATLSG
jgi:hypothetical protein